MLFADRLVDFEHDAISVRMLVGEPQVGIADEARPVERPVAFAAAASSVSAKREKASALTVARMSALSLK